MMNYIILGSWYQGNEENSWKEIGRARTFEEAKKKAKRKDTIEEYEFIIIVKELTRIQ